MTRTLSKAEIAQATDDLINGPGYYVLEDLFSPSQVAQAREIIDHYSDKSIGATHFHGAHADKIHLQRRVWNLLNKGQVFIDMAAHEAVMSVFSKILGKQFILGSFAANRLLPGAPGQEPHVDYPYWDMHDIDEFPFGINASFHMNCQSLIALHDFTAQNGATGLVPHSQKKGVYPDQKSFDEAMIQIECGAGSMVLFVGMIWHCSMPNHSEADRTSVLGQYLPKFVKPMEDFKAAIHPDVATNASPDLRQLLGLDLRYPELLEEADSGNAEGRNT